MRASSSGGAGGGRFLGDVDTSLGKLLVEEKEKRKEFDKECQRKREEWYNLEMNYVKWEGELRGKERELLQWEGELRELEGGMEEKLEEMRRDNEREFKVRKN